MLKVQTPLQIARNDKNCTGLTAENRCKQITNLNGGDPEAAGLEQDADAAGRHPLPQPAHHPARHQHILHLLQNLHAPHQNQPNQSQKKKGAENTTNTSKDGRIRGIHEPKIQPLRRRAFGGRRERQLWAALEGRRCSGVDILPWGVDGVKRGWESWLLLFPRHFYQTRIHRR